MGGLGHARALGSGTLLFLGLGLGHALECAGLGLTNGASFAALRHVEGVEAVMPARETDVIGVEVPDHPGALARLMALFRDEGVQRAMELHGTPLLLLEPGRVRAQYRRLRAALPRNCFSRRRAILRPAS